MFDFAAARKHMVESQIRTNDVTDYALLSAFRRVPRENFVPASRRALAYVDTHIALDDGHVIISPRDIAKMIQAAEIKLGEAVLDIGCTRGYSTAILAHLAETVIGLETSDETVEKATKALTQIGIDNAVVVKGELKSGSAEHGPFNVIFVNGAVASTPQVWLDQLADNGRLVLVTRSGALGRARIYLRTGSHFGEQVIFDSHMPFLRGFEPQKSFAF